MYEEWGTALLIGMRVRRGIGMVLRYPGERRGPKTTLYGDSLTMQNMT